ncbi:MAG: ABC transporter substrate-binding protein [Dehalococcoidales bacterium]|nr:ABC transporter substrate-binding protein [Dehalococcoidales bacterium]
MKKLLVVILMVAMAVSLILAGCSSTTTTSAPAVQAPAKTTGAAPTAAQSTAAAPAKTSAAPVITSMAPPPTTAGTRAKKGGVIRLIFTEVPTGSIGVPENMKGLSGFYVAPMFEPLIRGNSDGSFSPLLAESWEWSSDNLTLTLKLRKGVKFHDGSDFNASVAKWNFEREMAAMVTGSDNVASYSIIDDYTFQIKIKKYQNTWFGSLARSSTLGSQISQANYEKNGVEYADWHPVGTGPFKFTKYVENDYLEMERNENYWGDKALLDGVKELFIADAVTQQISFEAGEADILESVQGAAAIELSQKDYALDMSSGLGNMLIPSSGIEGSPYQKKEVRMAVEHAINKESIIRNIGMGYWKELTQIVGEGKLGYVSSIQPRKYDPQKAKALLAQAGYPNGFNTKLTCAVIFNNDSVTAMQADLNAVGINTELNIVSAQKWLDNMVNGLEEGLTVEPITTMETDFGVNMNRYWVTPLKQQYGAGCWWTTMKRPAGLDQMIQDYLVIPDYDGQKAQAEKITRLMFDDATAIPLWETTTIIVQQKYVKEMNYGKLGWPYFNFTGAWMDK